MGENKVGENKVGDPPLRGAMVGQGGPHSPLVLVAQPGLWSLVCLVLPAQARGRGESPWPGVGAAGGSAHPGQLPASHGHGHVSPSPPGMTVRPLSPLCPVPADAAVLSPRAGDPGHWDCCHLPRSRADLGGHRDPASRQGPGDPRDPSCQEHPLRPVLPAGTEEPGEADPVRSSAAPLGVSPGATFAHLRTLLALTSLGAGGAGWTLRRGETRR